MRLHLGCGKLMLKGWRNVDSGGKADLTYDLNRFPYPWKDSSVDEVRMVHVLEHLYEPRDVIREIWRICKPGAMVEIRVPWWTRQTIIRNPEHRHDFHPDWFLSFDESTEAHHMAYGSYAERPKERFNVTFRKSYNYSRRFKGIPGVWPLTSRRWADEMVVMMKAVKN